MIPRWPYFILAREVHGTAFFEKHSFQTQCKNQLLHSVAASEMMSVRARSIVLLSCYSPLSAALDVMRGVQRADCRCDIAAEARTKNPYQYSDLRQRAGRRWTS